MRISFSINRYPTITIAIFMIASLLPLQAREIMPFNNNWSFKKGPFPQEVIASVSKWNSDWEPVSIPHTWNANDMQQKTASFYEGDGYYRKEFTIPTNLLGKKLFLRFEGVGSCAEVYVNKQLVATHQGGYSAFACEISNALKSQSSNEIIVKADNKARPDVLPVNHSLFGVYGGIYRPIWLVATDSTHISVTDCASAGVYISQKNVTSREADIQIKVKLDNGNRKPKSIVLENTIYTQEGKFVKRSVHNITLPPQGSNSYTADMRLHKPHLWHGRRDPYLYKVVTRILSEGKIIDEVIQPLGVRNYEIIAGKGFYLNGEKYPMYGVTRHQDWWGIGSALKNEHHDADLAMIMDIGATTVRFAHYQQSDYLYSRCDSLGLIIWAEIPFVNRVTGKEAENAHTQLKEMIRQSFNHPSIYVWGLHNEVYHPHAYTAQLTKSLHDLAKTEDPGRFTVAVNGYGHMEHPVNQQADIQGMNRYFGWYEKKIQDIDPWIRKLQKDYPQHKFMLTEYGADANTKHQTEILGDALNWSKPFYPETFQTKTHEYQWSIIQQNPYIIASYLWNMFDFAVPMWSRGGVEARNMKGLVTFDRQLKKDSYYWYKANWSKEPVLYLTQRRLKNREKEYTSITVYSNCGKPNVYHNGELLTNLRKGYTDVHYIADSIQLKKGKNVIYTNLSISPKDSLSDQIEWLFTQQTENSANEFVNKEEHAGW